MGASFLQGNSIYYLPMLIVQCLLFGATTDYGLLLTAYYREAREKLNPKDAIVQALNHSIHTILTSGLILMFVTGLLGFFFKGSDPAISEILIIIGTGTGFAMLLVCFVLPGLLCAFDRFIVKNESKQL
jgi:predicted RND superfamily exporter protein